jgi:beta-galactosidase
MKPEPFLNSRLPNLWHGGDYNFEQWTPKIWDEDMALMKEARFKVATLGVFSWCKLEPEEGHFEFDWLDEIIERLSTADRYFILATPSATPPPWMGHQYPEIIRTGSDRVRRRFGNRVNYNLGSAIYRQKCRSISHRLAERYGDHPRLLAWHASNEYGGADFGSESITAFQKWLQGKYGSLAALNEAYWSTFWSHRYSNWDQIDAPGEPYAETSIPALTVDWKRFVTDQTVEFMLNEISPLRSISPEVPITSNFMGAYPGVNYRQFSAHLDFASWDSYPGFGTDLTEVDTWIATAFKHDLTRCLDPHRRWMLMECSPSSSNWYSTMALKKPGMHRFEVLQAVAHGADGVHYFQWRQSRGSQEQLHGAVLGHGSKSDRRVFADVAEVGLDLEEMAGIAGSRVEAHVAIIFDWEARWALEAACGPIQGDKKYESTAIDYYRPFWEAGIPVDVVGPNDDLSGYRLVLAPMMYSLQPNFAERISKFVEAGGSFVTTYLSGWTDENSLIFENGFLGPLRELLGVWSEEVDALTAKQSNYVLVSGLGMDGSYECTDFCELVHPTTAYTLATYGKDFYQGRAALTVNDFGKGHAYYVASRNESNFTSRFLLAVAYEAQIFPLIEILPDGVTAQRRLGTDRSWTFLMNATSSDQYVSTQIWGDITLAPWGVCVLESDAEGSPIDGQASEMASAAASSTN